MTKAPRLREGIGAHGEGVGRWCGPCGFRLHASRLAAFSFQAMRPPHHVSRRCFPPGDAVTCGRPCCRSIRRRTGAGWAGRCIDDVRFGVLFRACLVEQPLGYRGARRRTGRRSETGASVSAVRSNAGSFPSSQYALYVSERGLNRCERPGRCRRRPSSRKALRGCRLMIQPFFRFRFGCRRSNLQIPPLAGNVFECHAGLMVEPPGVFNHRPSAPSGPASMTSLAGDRPGGNALRVGERRVVELSIRAIPYGLKNVDSAIHRLPRTVEHHVVKIRASVTVNAYGHSKSLK